MTVAMWLLILVDVAVLLVAVGVVLYLLRRRCKAASVQQGEWCQEARKLAAEVQETAASVERPVDYDEVSRRLLPLAARIGGHVRTAPAGVDPDQLRRFFELGASCERVATEFQPAEVTVDGPFLEDQLDSLCAGARSLEDRLGSD